MSLEQMNTNQVFKSSSYRALKWHNWKSTIGGIIIISSSLTPAEPSAEEALDFLDLRNVGVLFLLLLLGLFPDHHYDDQDNTDYDDYDNHGDDDEISS